MNRFQNTWTKDDDDILKDAYREGLGPTYISRNLLPDRTIDAVSARAVILRVAKKSLRYVRPASHYNPIRIPDEPHRDLTGFLMGDPTPSRSALQEA